MSVVNKLGEKVCLPSRMDKLIAFLRFEFCRKNPTRMRRVQFLILWLQGFTVDEIADSYGVPKGTVFRGIERVREELGQEFAPPPPALICCVDGAGI